MKYIKNTEIVLFYARKSPKIRYHNPEVVGSSPASATKKPLELFGFQEVFLYIWLVFTK